MKNLFTLLNVGHIRRNQVSRTFLLPLLITLVLIVISGVANAQTNTWQGGSSGNWNTPGNWTMGVPTSAHDVLINTPAAITVNAAPTINSLTISNSANVIFTSSPGTRTITIGGNTASAIGLGSSLTLQGNVTPGYMRIIYTGTSNTMSIAGTLTLNAVGLGGKYTATNSVTTVTGSIINDGTGGGTPGVVASNSTNLIFSSGGSYLHAVDGGDIPTATWNSGSTCSVTGITGTACTSLNQSFSNLTWNCPSQTVAVIMSAAPQIIGGNLYIQTTGSGSLVYCNNTTVVSAATLTVDGNFNLSAGTFNLSTTTCTRLINFKIMGNFTINGGTFTKEGALTHNVNFNKTGTQDFTKTGGTITNAIDFRVLSGSTLNMGLNILDGSASNFALFSGGGIITAHPDGLVDAGTNAGSIQVGGTRTYSVLGDYVYNGTSAQVTGTGLGTSNNLTIDNAAGVTLTNTTTTVNGTLLINSGKKLTIDPTKRLTVNGTFTNNAGTAGLLIKSDVTGTGSLIENSTGVSATVERYITGNRWHFISAPVSGAVSGMFAGKYLQKFNEPTNTYTDITSSFEPLTPVKGFALWGDAAGFTSLYTGPLNTGNLSIGLTRSGADNNFGWNLVGNPYPSSIDWTLAGWTKTNLNDAIYIEKNGGWATYITGAGTNGGTQWIAPGQGFMVEVTNGQSSGTLGLSNAVKFHRQTTFFKNSNAGGFARLEVSGNEYTDEAIVRFMPEATSEFDGQLDAHKLFGYVDESAQIYTLGSEPLTINSTVPETSEVSLGIRANTAGTYTIAATELVDIPVLALEDTKTGIFTDLLYSSYTFTSEPGEDEVRFMLHFGTTAVNVNESAIANIYTYQKTVFVDLKDQDKGNIYIYNIAGQLLTTAPAAKGMNGISLPETGIYMVKVITANSTMVKKVWIQ